MDTDQPTFTYKEVYNAILHEMIEAEARGQSAWDRWEALDNVAIRLGMDCGEMLEKVQQRAKERVNG
jgi:hypothetical protein